MAPRSKQPELPEVSGGESVDLTQVTHGLGRKAQFFESLAAEREALGLTEPTPTRKTKKTDGTTDGSSIAAEQLGTLDSGLPADASTTDDGTNADNAIDVPVGRLLREQLEDGLSRLYSTDDTQKTDSQQLADKIVQDTLRQIISADAMLFVPPDEFAAVRQEIKQVAEEGIRAAKALKPKSDKHGKKSPVNEEALKREVMRDPLVKQFRSRHNALFHYPGIRHSAPETGIEPVAAIDGKHGSIGADHGRYRAKT